MENIARLIYYGASVEFLLVVVAVAVVVLVAGLRYRGFLWGVVRSVEGFSNAVGRIVAWGLLIMVLQQTMIVMLQRIFRVAEITIGPIGYAFTRDVGWFAEELRLYNAAAVALCAAYTFVQGGHVRVDLFYARFGFRGKRVIDLLGALFFVLPFMTIIWWFGWYFMWRHLVTPKVAAGEAFASLMRKASLMRWNVETIGFSPAGFDGFFIFKILLVGFAGMMFVQGLASFYRNLLELIEGPESHDRFADIEETTEEEAADHARHLADPDTAAPAGAGG